MCMGKVFIDHDFVILGRIGKPAFPDVKTIQQRLAVIGNGENPGGNRFGKPLISSLT